MSMWEILTITALQTPKGEEAVHFWQIENWKLLFVLRQGPSCPRTHKDLPASASQVLGLKACAMTPGLLAYYFLCGGVYCQIPLELEPVLSQHEGAGNRMEARKICLFKGLPR